MALSAFSAFSGLRFPGLAEPLPAPPEAHSSNFELDYCYYSESGVGGEELAREVDEL